MDFAVIKEKCKLINLVVVGEKCLDCKLRGYRRKTIVAVVRVKA